MWISLFKGCFDFVFGDTEYEVEGKNILLNDGSKVSILRSFINHENFVKVSYKVDAEDGNRKFFFEVVENGILISKSRIHVVEEEGKIVANLLFVDETQISRYRFNIVEENGITIINIRYDIRVDGLARESGNVHIEVIYDTETGEVIYTYKILDIQVKQGNTYKKQIEKRHNKGERNNHSQGL